MKTEILDFLKAAKTYRDLQAALKAVRKTGYTLGCRLNAGKAALLAEKIIF